jgi:hypothetical protein
MRNGKENSKEENWYLNGKNQIDVMKGRKEGRTDIQATEEDEVQDHRHE